VGVLSFFWVGHLGCESFVLSLRFGFCLLGGLWGLVWGFCAFSWFLRGRVHVRLFLGELVMLFSLGVGVVGSFLIVFLGFVFDL